MTSLENIMTSEGSGYFLYHSIGQYPGKADALAQAMAEFAQVWGAPDDAQWGYALGTRARFVDRWRAIIGAPEGTVTTCENVTQGLHMLITALPQGYLHGKRVLVAGDCFPSNHFLLTGLQDRLGFTELRTDADGVVTTRRLEAGEVVQPGQVVFRLARDDGRDAVFDVSPRFLDQQPTGGVFKVALASDPNVSVTGRVREIAPQADAATGTFRIRVGLDKKLPAMALGSTVVGVLEKSSALVVAVPASALTIVGTDPAVWVVDQATSKVTLRRIAVMRFEYATVMVAHGLEAGEMVVSGGIQALHPGQIVKAAPSAARRAALSSSQRAVLVCHDVGCG
jgi:multidrug efflux pump subunit AcrA (membrane-fusion protein)